MAKKKCCFTIDGEILEKFREKSLMNDKRPSETVEMLMMLFIQDGFAITKSSKVRIENK